MGTQEYRSVCNALGQMVLRHSEVKDTKGVTWRYNGTSFQCYMAGDWYDSTLPSDFEPDFEVSCA